MTQSKSINPPALETTIGAGLPVEIPPMPEVLAELINYQGKLSDKEFCKEYGFAYDETNWNKIKRWYCADPTKEQYGKPYYKGTLENALVECEKMLRSIKERRAVAAKVRQGTDFIEFLHLQTVMDRVNVLLESKHIQNRLVVYLAPSGGGKTTLGREICARKTAVMVEARESWRDSYAAALRDIARSLRVGDDAKNLGDLEQAIIEQLCATRTVLVIDEGEYFGPKSINIFKLILNHTPTVVLLCAIPEMWARVKRVSWAEAAQIVRRTDHMETLTLIHPADVQLFAEARGLSFNGSTSQSCKEIAAAANHFGRYDFIVRVCDRLKLESPDEPVHISQVSAAIHAVRAMMGVRGGAQ